MLLAMDPSRNPSFPTYSFDEFCNDITKEKSKPEHSRFKDTFSRYDPLPQIQIDLSPQHFQPLSRPAMTDYRQHHRDYNYQPSKYPQTFEINTNSSYQQQPLPPPLPQTVTSQKASKSYFSAQPPQKASAVPQPQPLSTSSLPIPPSASSVQQSTPVVAHQPQKSPRTIPSPRGSSTSTSSSIPSIDGFIYQVFHKKTTYSYILAVSAPLDIAAGEYVIVEGDRGEDLGIVQEKYSVDRHELIQQQRTKKSPFAYRGDEIRYLFRRALPAEIATLRMKYEDEEKALKDVRERIVVKRLPMFILDAEYQFDRKKLTFYFVAHGRVDFREFTTELYQFYKTRIWLQQVDQHVLR